MAGPAKAMISGQSLDVVQEDSQDDSDRMLQCYLLKSAALYAAAAECGAILCGARPTSARRIAKAGEFLGMAYQFMDDVADATATVEQLGKETGQDADKFTAVNWLGVDGARRMSEPTRAKPWLNWKSSEIPPIGCARWCARRVGLADDP